jgi:hypothetical protein
VRPNELGHPDPLAATAVRNGCCLVPGDTRSLSLSFLGLQVARVARGPHQVMLETMPTPHTCFPVSRQCTTYASRQLQDRGVSRKAPRYFFSFEKYTTNLEGNQFAGFCFGISYAPTLGLWIQLPFRYPCDVTHTAPSLPAEFKRMDFRFCYFCSRRHGQQF